jgi:hypothetical protein
MMAQALRGGFAWVGSASLKEGIVSSNRRSGGMGCFSATALALVVIFIPVIGHIILTVMILGDDLSAGEKILWLIVVWIFWIIGPFMYLLLGQRRNRLFGQMA